MKFKDIPMNGFFQIDGQVFKKNSTVTAMHVSTPMFGEIYIYAGSLQEKAIQPYVPPTSGVPLVVPKDPEEFEIKIVPRPEPDANFGATTIHVTPADSKIELGIQPPSDTGKRPKKAAKAVADNKPTPPKADKLGKGK
jgi:hypothetical protein